MRGAPSLSFKEKVRVIKIFYKYSECGNINKNKMIPGIDAKTMRVINKWKWFAIIAPILFYIFIFMIIIGVVVGVVRTLAQDMCGGWKNFIVRVVLVGEDEAAFNALCRLGKGISGGAGATDGWCSTSVTGSNPIPADKIDQYMPWVTKAADVYMQGDTASLIAIIDQESGWKNDNYNTLGLGHVGFGQFDPPTARAYVEFTGSGSGKDGHTNVVWGKATVPDGATAPGDGDPRTNPMRAIYATARSLSKYGENVKSKSKEVCEPQSGIDKWACYWGWNHHTGLSRTDKSSNAYKEAVAGVESIKNKYNSLNVVTEECVGGSGGSIYAKAVETILDIEKSGEDTRKNDMSEKTSVFSKTPKPRSWSDSKPYDKNGKISRNYYADCGHFVGYVVRGSADPDFPEGGTTLQFGYVTGVASASSSGFSGSKIYKTKTGKTYQVFRASSSKEIQPGDILFANDGGHITIADAGGAGAEFSASQNSRGPERTNDKGRMTVVARPLFGGEDGVAGNPDETLSCSGLNIQKMFLDFTTKYAGKTRLEHMADYNLKHYGVSTSKLVPKAVVWHYTTSVNSSGSGIRSLFNGQEKYSDEYPRPFAHFLIDKDGKIFQYASTSVTARHAPGVNNNSIGIEFSGNDESDILNNTKQYDAGLALTKCLMARNGISSKNVVGHGEVRKNHPLYGDITGYDTGHTDWDNSMDQVRERLKK